VFISGQSYRDHKIPSSWRHITCRGQKAIISKEFIDYEECIYYIEDDEELEDESEPKDLLGNTYQSDSRNDEYLPYYTQEDCDTSWWDDELDHNE
jgi:hypothetical protein